MTEYIWTEKTLCCRFAGRLDSTTAPAIEIVLEREMIKQPEQVLFDLASIDYISSAFLRICIKSAKAVEPGCFSIIHAGPQLKKVFKMVNLDELLNITS